MWFIARAPRLPWWLRVLALAVAAYAFSPIDLIPDVIPVLGLLDDLLLVPLGVALILRFAPAQVRHDARVRVQAATERPVSVAAAVIALVWMAAAAGLWRWW